MVTVTQQARKGADLIWRPLSLLLLYLVTPSPNFLTNPSPFCASYSPNPLSHRTPARNYAERPPVYLNPRTGSHWITQCTGLGIGVKRGAACLYSTHSLGSQNVWLRKLLLLRNGPLCAHASVRWRHWAEEKKDDTHLGRVSPFLTTWNGDELVCSKEFVFSLFLNFFDSPRMLDIRCIGRWLIWVFKGDLLNVICETRGRRVEGEYGAGV